MFFDHLDQSCKIVFLVRENFTHLLTKEFEIVSEFQRMSGKDDGGFRLRAKCKVIPTKP